MWYMIIGEDVKNSLEMRQASRPAHLARIKRLADEARLLVAGPNPHIDNDFDGIAGFSGSLIIAEFESLEDAQNWADKDPYMTAGVYQNVIVKPFKPVLP